MSQLINAHGRFLDSLPGDLADRLLQLTERTFSTGSGFYFPYAGVTLVLQGIATVSKLHASGREVLTSFRGPGGLIGEECLMADGDESYTVPSHAWSLTPVKVKFIGLEQFRRFMADHPEAWVALAKEQAGRLAEAKSRLGSVACENADKRHAVLAANAGSEGNGRRRARTEHDQGRSGVLGWSSSGNDRTSAPELTRAWNHRNRISGSYSDRRPKAGPYRWLQSSPLRPRSRMTPH